MSKTELTPAPKRRADPKALKAQIAAQCSQTATSVAGVALSHSLNANLVHKGIRNAGWQNPAAPGVRADRVARGFLGRQSYPDPLVARSRAINGALARKRSGRLRGVACVSGCDDLY